MIYLYYFKLIGYLICNILFFFGLYAIYYLSIFETASHTYIIILIKIYKCRTISCRVQHTCVIYLPHATLQQVASNSSSQQQPLPKCIAQHLEKSPVGLSLPHGVELTNSSPLPVCNFLSPAEAGSPYTSVSCIFRYKHTYIHKQ